MLADYKKTYEQQAALIKNFEQISKTELCNTYVKLVEKKDKLSDAYLSAIILKYWPAISKYYYMSFTAATIEDCYEWVIGGISYALSKHIWLDKDSKLYLDPNGPDKVINRCIQSERLTWYQAINRSKRKINFANASYDQLESSFSDEDSLDQIYYNDTSFIVNQYIQNIFNKKDYFLAFFLDAIINTDCIKEDTHNIDLRYISKHFRNLSKKYLEFFSQNYQIDYQRVESAVKYIRNLPSYKIYKKLQVMLENLKRDKVFISYLKG